MEEEEEDEDEDDDEVDDDDDDFGLDLMDLPDHALANAFFSGFLDSIKVVSCLRLVSKRMMAVGSDSCKVRIKERETETQETETVIEMGLDRKSERKRIITGKRREIDKKVRDTEICRRWFFRHTRHKCTAR